MPDHVLSVFGLLGFFALWRYGWWITHAVRAVLYLRIVYPRICRRARGSERISSVEGIHVVVASYNIPASDFAVVYRALFSNILESKIPGKVVASVTSASDEAVLRQVYNDMGRPEAIQCIVQFQTGEGKRQALGKALRALRSRCMTGRTVVALLDGDVLLEPMALARCIALLSSDPELCAVTANNSAVVKGSAALKAWYELKHANRHLNMCSLSLSGRLLVLTGRFSVVRTEDALDDDFIAAVESDYIDHWRMGRIRCITGDDKSTWYHLMRRGRRMLYVPDAMAVSLEASASNSSFVQTTSRLMMRWYGNMLRANVKAIMLPPWRIGVFTWWCILDQRLSVWTALTGPVTALVLAFSGFFIAIPAYILWTITVRCMMSLLVGTLHGHLNILWPWMMIYNQIWGAMIKIHLVFHLDTQGWRHQGFSRATSGQPLVAVSSGFLQVAALLSFLVLVTGLAGLHPVEPGSFAEVEWLFLQLMTGLHLPGPM
ncbi:glycosyltransferase [Aestuariivirga sp.]|jgi:glycosyltransferase Alg8|uniref:glycosyltransferase n=1 Tax=Aestuariivirga sp. TaxID=2650926 RepID=UPI003783D439